MLIEGILAGRGDGAGGGDGWIGRLKQKDQSSRLAWAMESVPNNSVNLVKLCLKVFYKHFLEGLMIFLNSKAIT